ncbi:MAG: ABC transporter permease [Candidatus Woesearchaeota archaeon]
MNTKRTYYLVKKNLKLLVRSKSSSLVIILAPLILILLIGFSYNTSQTGLNIGVYSPQYDAETDTFIQSLQQENYKIIKYTQAKECIEDIKLGFVHTCLVLPQEFKIEDNSPKEIIFYIDQSKINLVYMITSVVNNKFNIKSEEISEQLASDVLTKLVDTKAKIDLKLPEVQQTRTQSSQAVTEIKNTGSDLNTIDLKTPNNSYQTSALGEFKDNASSEINLALKSIADAKTIISSSSINSSDKSSLNSYLNSADTKLDHLQELVNGSGKGSLNDISEVMIALQRDLNNTKTKLTSASEKISLSGNKLSSVTTSLNQGIASLDSLEKTLNEIQQELSSQKVTDASVIASPISIKIEKVSVGQTYLNYMFPSLLVLVVMFISILLGTTLVMMDKHSPAYFRNFIVPVRKTTFIVSTYLTNCLIIFIQIAILIGISIIFLDDILSQLPWTVLILFISSSVFTLIGMFIGYVFISEDTGTLASISVSSLLLFVSGVVLPLESMPTAIRQVVHYNPFVISEKLVREVFLFKSGFSVMLDDFLILVGYALILFITILIIDSLAGKHYFTKIFYNHSFHSKKKKPSP